MTVSSDLLTLPQAAEVLNITLRELRILRQRRRLAFCKMGHRTIRIHRRDIEAFQTRVRIPSIYETVKR